ALLVIAIPLNPPASFATGALSFVADAMSIGALGLVAGVWLATRPARAEATPPLPSTLLGYSAPSPLVWTPDLLVFWPGLMSPDSLEQWRQVLQGEINNEHPAFHTLTIWLITRVWFSPAAVALTQILALALMFGLVIRELERWSLSRWARIAV